MADIPTAWLHGDTYSPSDVAQLFGVHPRTVTGWAQRGIIGFFRTPSGMRRYPEVEVRRLMAQQPAPPFIRELAEADNKKYGEKWDQGWRRSEKSGFQRRTKTVGEGEL